MNKLVIFDCDGVLVDSEPLASQALVDCLADLRIVMSAEEANRRFKGRKNADCLLEIDGDKLVNFNNRFEADGMKFEEPTPNLFSFNNPYGACPTCDGLGFQEFFDPQRFTCATHSIFSVRRYV